MAKDAIFNFRQSLGKDKIMAIYVLECHECEHVFEKIMRMDAANPECPSCGCDKTEKQITAPAAAIFSGIGCYAEGKRVW